MFKINYGNIGIKIDDKIYRYLHEMKLYDSLTIINKLYFGALGNGWIDKKYCFYLYKKKILKKIMFV